MKTLYVRKSKRSHVWEVRSADLRFWTRTIMPTSLPAEWIVARLEQIHPGCEIILEVSK